MNETTVPVTVDNSGLTNNAGSDSQSYIQKDVHPEIQGTASAYGEVDLSESIGPVSVAMNPTIVRGDATSRLSGSAAQSGDNQWTALIKLLIPALAAVALAYITKTQEGSHGYI